jgi:hypothetical protein
MLAFDDPRWETFTAGYRVPVDLRPLLRQLEASADAEATWHEVWEELYHQGDVGPGTFAAVPHLVRIHRERGVPDWNTYALACTVELARGVGANPDVPEWMRSDYDKALNDLFEIGLHQFPRATDPSAVRSILALLALVKGARTYARVLIDFSEDEVQELEAQAFGDAR